MGFVREKRLRQPRLGTRKRHNLIRTEPDVSVKVGRDRLFDILRDRRELVPPRRAYHRTTDSHHRFRRHPNLLKDGPTQVVAKAPEQVWDADITYLPTQTGVAYLSLITDAYSRKIVGHHVHDSLHTESVIQAFNKALKQWTMEQRSVHHSDMSLRQVHVTRKDRHPRDLSPEIHASANEWLMKNFGVFYRSQSVFVTSDLNVAVAYADSSAQVARVVPIDNYSFCWSKQLRNMMELFIGGVVIGRVHQELDAAGYTKSDLSSAHSSGHEVILFCDSYLSIPQNLL